MKRFLIFFLTLLLLAAVPVTALAEETVYTDKTLYYTIADGSVTITGCFGKDSVVTIPASIAGLPVNTIASGAFTGNSSVQEVNLPDTITTIEENAFSEEVHVVYQGKLLEETGLAPQESFAESTAETEHPIATDEAIDDVAFDIPMEEQEQSQIEEIPQQPKEAETLETRQNNQKRITGSIVAFTAFFAVAIIVLLRKKRV